MKKSLSSKEIETITFEFLDGPFAKKNFEINIKNLTRWKIF